MDTNRILEILRSHAPELQAARLEHLRLFGSAARGEATPHSDIDLLADFTPGSRISLLTLSGLRLRLSDLLGTEVDLSSAASLKNPYEPAPIARQSVSFRGPEMHFQDILKAISLIEQPAPNLATTHVM